MPHFAIKLATGKSGEQKQALAQAVVETARRIIGYDDDAYSVTIEDVRPEEWLTTVYENDIIRKEDILYKKPGYTKP